MLLAASSGGCFVFAFMKRFLPFLFSTSTLHAELLNPSFDDSPFNSGWTSSGASQGASLIGDAGNCATLTSGGSIHQDFADDANDALSSFQITFALQVGTLDTASRLRLRGDGNATDIMTLRPVATGIDVYRGTASGGSAFETALNGFPLAANSTVYVRLTGTDFALAGRKFTVGLSNDGTNFTTSGELTVFHSAAVGTRFETIRFDTTSGGGMEIDAVDLVSNDPPPVPPETPVVREISGVYPHLAMTNSHLECGVGAVVPWADKLWVITYGPHLANGSTDKLYEIAPDLSRVIRPESVGGTPANRMIHTESNQLNIGPYFIDDERNVRVLQPSAAPGRLTATARHLTDPNRLYIFTMEDGVYDVNPSDLSFITRYPDVQGTGDRFLFGYHGKGAYTGQGKLVVANNGRPNNQGVPTGAAGVLATWDGTTVQENGGGWLQDGGSDFFSGNGAADGAVPPSPQPQYLHGWVQVTKTQHCEVTGPGGIYGSSDPENDPIWSTGFDAKSVMLHVMEGGQWKVWRLPKASYTHDGSHGWHTEWPRIRQLDPSDAASPYLMHMHGLFYDFPKTFSAANFAGLEPISGYYKMPTDYAMWNGKIVMGKNDASQFNNALALKDQSNLWFGTMEDVGNWGAPSGHGSVWMNEAVNNGDISDAFLVSGFPQRTLHLRNTGASSVDIEIQTSAGTPSWTPVRTINVPAGGYVSELVSDLAAPWVRLACSGSTANLTAFFHMSSPYPHPTPASVGSDEFAALADIRDTRSMSDGMVRVMNNTELQLEFASSKTDGSGSATQNGYHRIGAGLVLNDVDDATAESSMRSSAALTQEFGSDDASAWVSEGSVKFRLPKLDPLYDQPFAAGWARGIREVVTERELLNCHGTFYEVPRDNSGGMRKMRAITTHGKRITDFASWRGLLVLTGVLDDAPASDTLVRNADGSAALWLGEVDDIWRMGEPRGKGGPWKETVVAANTPSDPYLMYGYDRKELTVSATDATTITVEVDFLADNTWSTYQTFELAAGESVTHVFPEGFHAHWVRVKSSAATTASAQFIYGPADTRDAFLDWARDQGLATGEGRSAIIEDDDDGDHLAVSVEYLVAGGDPSEFTANPVIASDSEASVVLRDLSIETTMTVRAEISRDLSDWVSQTVELEPSPDQSGVDEGFIRYRIILPENEPREFVRLSVG